MAGPQITHDKRSKESVDYSKGGVDHCGVCTHFQSPNACELVAGEIRPDYWCKLFKRKRRMTSRGIRK